MFEYISGTLTGSLPHKITVEVGGLGYGLHISLATYQNLPQIGTKVKVFISTVIREDSHKLYAFLTVTDRDFFETLIEISGIGPRLALSILGHMSLADLHLAVDHGNTKAISQVPGIGKKMSERLVLELRDKFGKGDKGKISLSDGPGKGVVADAISALINLGYHPLEAQKSIQAALPKGELPPLSDLISLALKAKKG